MIIRWRRGFLISGRGKYGKKGGRWRKWTVSPLVWLGPRNAASSGIVHGQATQELGWTLATCRMGILALKSLV